MLAYRGAKKFPGPCLGHFFWPGIAWQLRNICRDPARLVFGEHPHYYHSSAGYRLARVSSALTRTAFL
jgi:hypothetical protein